MTYIIQKKVNAGSPPKKGCQLLNAVYKYMYMLPDFGTTVLSSPNGKQAKIKTQLILSYARLFTYKQTKHVVFNRDTMFCEPLTDGLATKYFRRENSNSPGIILDY